MLCICVYALKYAVVRDVVLFFSFLGDVSCTCPRPVDTRWIFLVFVAAWIMAHEKEIKAHYRDLPEVNDVAYQDDIKAPADSRDHGFQIDDEFFTDVHNFYLLFSPLLILVTLLEADDISLPSACPLIFQTFQMYTEMHTSCALFSTPGKWASSLNILLHFLWQHTLGGEWGPLICASYALTACGWASLQQGFFFLFFSACFYKYDG
jgi:hypothetical protein